MSLRPLVSVSGLTLGDYLLWHWSLNHNHDVLALVSGLTLPPLGVALLWLLALSAVRLLARFGRMPVAAGRGHAEVGPPETGRAAPGLAGSLEEAPVPASGAGRTSGKLAA